MFCPQCGQERISMDTNYCSRCGFLLVAVGELLHTGGQSPIASPNPASGLQSPRKRGLKQGLFLFLLTFLVAPLMGMVSLALDIEPFLVGIAVIVCFIGGLLRMVYALMFEEAYATNATSDNFLDAAKHHLNRAASAGALPPQKSTPVSAYTAPKTGNWRDTNDLQPTSVVEGTTKLLEKDELSQ